MPDKWTGVLIGKMHNHDVTQQNLADELGISKGYVSQILTGYRNTPGAKEKFNDAYNRIISNRVSNKRYRERGDLRADAERQVLRRGQIQRQEG